MILEKIKIKLNFPDPRFWKYFIGHQFILQPNERTILGNKIEVENDLHKKIIVFGSWYPYAYDFEKYSEYQKNIEIEREKKHEERKLFYENLKKEAIEFNNSLEIPVKWSSEIKQVLSGLSEKSSGNGWKKNTVRHIYLHESFSSGRLKREAKNFLCSQVKSKYSGNWSGTLGENGLEYKVNCQKCLEISNKLKTKNSK
ncbi:hypothetical protein [Flavobacterium capsici]|uniref:Uncharacterized protein n=1 Tax=Flavobacterium capsici TaxID=3075618 RepID=A0AA96EYT9_9FLAO|nr:MULTISPECIES: hypothetical protein [unclassified Flavobacterium]WNM19258.1 hypothetical protein RN608_00915 [Flavobacterium sp. PMR2A8]WNM20647.1 hypothetical protein RN605_08085 [Flavobacterium sp. PMTSA4]